MPSWDKVVPFNVSNALQQTETTADSRLHFCAHTQYLNSRRHVKVSWVACDCRTIHSRDNWRCKSERDVISMKNFDFVFCFALDAYHYESPWPLVPCVCRTFVTSSHWVLCGHSWGVPCSSFWSSGFVLCPRRFRFAFGHIVVLVGRLDGWSAWWPWSFAFASCVFLRPPLEGGDACVCICRCSPSSSTIRLLLARGPLLNQRMAAASRPATTGGLPCSIR